MTSNTSLATIRTLEHLESVVCEHEAILRDRDSTKDSESVGALEMFFPAVSYLET